MSFYLYVAALVVSLQLATGATTQKPTHAPVVRNDVETELKASGQFNTVLDLINEAGLMDTLKGANHLSLFAPTDSALAKLPPGTIDTLKADPARLKDILGYHVVLDKALRLRGKNQDVVLTSSNNKPIRINSYRIVHSVSAEGVNVTMKDIAISNGYIHGLDDVMVPPEGNVVDILANRDDTKTLVSLLTQANLLDAIRNDMNITVFAPTDAAFAKVDPEILTFLSANPKYLQETLLYHVVKRLTLYSIGMKHTLTFPSGDQHHDDLMVLEDDQGNAFVNDAKITQTDISADNGVIHLIDDVLVPGRVLVAIEDNNVAIG